MNEDTPRTNRAVWFGPVDVARAYTARSRGLVNPKTDDGAIVAYRPVKKLVLFDVMDESNIRKLLEYHAGDVETTKAIMHATGFGLSAVLCGASRQAIQFFTDLKELPQDMYAVYDDALDGSLRVKEDVRLQESAPGREVRMSASKSGTYTVTMVRRTAPFEYAPLDGLFDSKDLGTHVVGKCENCFYRNSSSTESDSELMKAIKSMCEGAYPNIDVAGYHGCETFGAQGVFKPEIALFRGHKCVQKDCTIDIVQYGGSDEDPAPLSYVHNMFKEGVCLEGKTGGGAKSALFVQAMLAAVVLSFSVIQAI
jgi:hypothetical protein